MITREELIEIGIYNKPHGIGGEISATFDYDSNLIADLNCLISNINGIYVPFFIDDMRAKNNSTVLLKIDGIDNEKDAKLLVNKKIYAQKSLFKELCDEIQYDENSEELPLDYFIGFTLKNDDGEIIGTITDVDCTTENYLFIIEQGENNLLIPAADDLIMEMDIKERILIMSIPEGLLHI